MLHRAAAVTLLLLSFSIKAFCASSSPSDNEMRAILDADMANGCRRIGIGDLKVLHSGNTNYPKMLVSPDEFKETKAWAELGLVQLYIQELPLSNAMVSGIDATIRVIPTAKGNTASQAAVCKVVKNPQFIYVQQDPARVESLISNEEIKKDVSTYRVLKGVETTTNKELGMQITALMGIPFSPKLNFIKLYKFDEF